jgi:hypothetical protein
MKDLGLMAAGIVVLGALIVGIVSAGSESSDGSNTRNGVTVHAPLPVGATVEPNRLEAPNGR